MSKQKSAITEYRPYDLPAEFPIIVLTGDKWLISDVPAERLHFHNYMEFGICMSDKGFMEMGSETISFREGDITVISRNFPHTTYSARGYLSRWSWIFVDMDEFVKRHLPSEHRSFMGTANYLKFNREECPRLYNYLLAVIEEMTARKSGYTTAVGGIMSAVIVELFRLTGHAEEDPAGRTATRGNGYFTIRPVLDYIADHYMQSFTVDDMANLCGLSTTHFRRVFNSSMGTSPLKYLNSVRIDHACTALQNSDTPVLEISESIGFRSVSSFNREFLNLIGTTPREWRKAYNKGRTLARKQNVTEFRGWL